MPITILKNAVPWGPFSRAQIQEGLSRGDFTLEHLAHGPGFKEWSPLSEVLEHFDRSTMLPPVPGARNILPMPGPMLPPLPATNLEPSPAALDTSPIFPAVPRASVPPPMPMPRTASAAPLPAGAPVAPITRMPPPSAPAPLQQPVPPIKPAGFFPRFIAFAIDCGVLFLPVLFIFGLAALAIRIQDAVDHTNPEAVHQGWILWQQRFRDVLVLVAIGGAWLYAAGLECSSWQATVGKQWMRMKVVDEHGERLSFFRSTGRHAAKFLSALPAFLGFTMALFSSSRLALHDRIARTRVVKK